MKLSRKIFIVGVSLNPIALALIAVQLFTGNPAWCIAWISLIVISNGLLPIYTSVRNRERHE